MGRKKRPFREFEVDIEDLSHDGRGVARIDGKVWMVHGALPGERVRFLEQKGRRKVGAGKVLEVLRASEDRVEPACIHFGVCGGCATQHLAHDAQLEAKHNQLLTNLEKLGEVTPQEIFSPVTASAWGYRRRARLGVRLVPKKGGVLVGFRERGASYITGLTECHTMRPEAVRLLDTLPKLIESLSSPTRIPQVEVSVGDNVTTLVFRHLEPLGDTDHMLLRSWGQEHSVQVFLQPGGPDTVHCVWPGEPAPLIYRMGDFDLDIEFEPLDFVQVNGAMNEIMVKRALDLLAPQADETVLDLFCGIGNFTLPIARLAGRVVGVEGDQSLVTRALGNAQRNGLTNVEFQTADLYDDKFEYAKLDGPFDRLLIDPPRSGALEVVQQLNDPSIKRIVYVSCNPATLARDSQILVHEHGMTLTGAGIIDMFPHTAHVESIAVFDR